MGFTLTDELSNIYSSMTAVCYVYPRHRSMTHCPLFKWPAFVYHWSTPNIEDLAALAVGVRECCRLPDCSEELAWSSVGSACRSGRIEKGPPMGPAGLAAPAVGVGEKGRLRSRLLLNASDEDEKWGIILCCVEEPIVDDVQLEWKTDLHPFTWEEKAEMLFVLCN